VLFYGLKMDHAYDPWWWPFEVWGGGMSAHGGMLGIVLFTLWYSRRHRISWTGIGDSLCVVAPVGLFCGRIANFINGELWGKPTTLPWAVIFPDDPLPRHPSQIYEALLEGVLLFVVMWTLRTRIRVPRGVLTGVFFALYAVLRIVGEIFREPDAAWALGPLSAGQALSLGLIVMGVAFVAWGFRCGDYEAAWQR
jgi:phosphatidylglycerol:prolipoprotein diacylglycerol transferase